jgi:hypothetical protein
MIRLGNSYIIFIISLVFFNIVNCQQPVSTPTGLTVLPGDTTSVACGNTMLGGYLQFNPYAGAPLHETTWKSFRIEASQNAEVNCFKVFVKGLLGDRTDDEVGVAIYEDNNGEVGTLKASGYVEHYNWEILGTFVYHEFIFNTVHTDRHLITGQYYWITMQSSGYTNILIERGNTSNCAPLKRGAEHSSIAIPPQGYEFTIVYGNSCYGWSVW